MNELYEKIGKIAINASSPITFQELIVMLNSSTSSRGMASQVKAAHKYFVNKGESHIAGKITGTFVDKNGKYAFR